MRRCLVAELWVLAAEARCARHWAAVPLKVYAHCIDGQANEANRRINDALGTHDPQPDLNDEGDGEDEQAP
jgi:hypothetical protein